MRITVFDYNGKIFNDYLHKYVIPGDNGSGNISTINDEYVDLGLSVCWATCNLGAGKPEEYGNYYSWGETTPKEYFSTENYKWFVGLDDANHQFVYSKYNSADGNYVLELDDDAAHAALGGKWRTPTVSEAKELINNCNVQPASINGTAGLKFVSKKSGYTSKWIFLPFSGLVYGWGENTEINERGKNGYYMVSTQIERALLCLYEKGAYTNAVGYSRFGGYPVRPVKEK